LADQEFLASFGVDIDETGVSRLQQILTENQTLAQSLSDSFNAASESVKAFREQVAQDLPSLFSGSGHGNVTENLFGSAGGLKIGLNMTEPKKEIASFTAEAKKEIPLSANASGIVSAARTALENVRSLFSETFTINVRASTSTDNAEEKKDSRTDSRNRDDSGSTFLRMSTGGRFTSPTDVQVAEDGDAEYIIPVKKENQALPLVRQLLSELSPEARQSLTGPEQKAETETQDALSSLTVISPGAEDQSEQSVPDLRQAFSKEDRPLATAPIVEKQETSEKNIAAPATVIRDTFAEMDLPLAVAPATEKEEPPETVASAPLPVIRETFSEADRPLPAAPATEKKESQERIASVPAPPSVSEDRPADKAIDFSALLKELFETGKEWISTPQFNTASVPAEKEPAPQFSVPAPVLAVKEDASSLSASAPLSTVRESLGVADHLPAPVSAPEKEEKQEANAPVSLPLIRETFTEMDRSLTPAPTSEKDEKQETDALVLIPLIRDAFTDTDRSLASVSKLEKEERQKANIPVSIPPVREIFAEADHPLAPAPAAQTESLPSVASSPKQDLSELVSRLSSMIQPSGNTVTNTSNNLSAPVTINVKATGSNAEQIGETIYNTAERYLLRTMKGAFA